nr:hypothetical protein [Serratia sp. P2ACOL2]
MSALASISLSMHRLRFAKKRACAWLLVVSWLLLNTQLALASHNCNLQFSGEAPMAQHMHAYAKQRAVAAADADPRAAV